MAAIQRGHRFIKAAISISILGALKLQQRSNCSIPNDRNAGGQAFLSGFVFLFSAQYSTQCERLHRRHLAPDNASVLQITFSLLQTIKSLKQKNKLHPQLTRCVRIIKKIFVEYQRACFFAAIRK
ncbi:hypothetical protein Y887_14155 [Xanthomonas pisi DSM 18956]|nr:hypothetical protein Y887_14155 [Xanthomonas pisi DSM 18956]